MYGAAPWAAPTTRRILQYGPKAEEHPCHGGLCLRPQARGPGLEADLSQQYPVQQHGGVLYPHSQEGHSGKIYGRKYSILFQKEEDPAHLGEGVLSRNAKTELYILFENSYSDVVGPLDYPEPTEHGRPLFDKAEQGNTFRSSGVNDFGRFVWAYLTMELAKKRAVIQYQAVYGYAMSYLIADEEKP